MTVLSKYWPQLNEISNCIKAEAETISNAMLLSVHQEMPILKRTIGTSQADTKIDEKQFLSDFLNASMDEGTLIMPISGQSGSGKSHLIRWLHANLIRLQEQGDARVKSFNIIKIPKSASMRKVVELILETLPSNNDYNKIRKNLKEASSEVTLDVGAQRLRGGIAISLNSMNENLTTELKLDPNATENKLKRRKAHFATNLVHYLSDGELSSRFNVIFSRIIKGAIDGLSDEEDRDLTRRFSAEDLHPSSDEDIDNASMKVKRFFENFLASEDGKGYQTAAEVLNEVLDDAISEVYKLQSTGIPTMEELILQIREGLLKDGQELILLIEDFYALMGYQESLLKVIIQNDSEDGKRVRSPMRTVLAVTSGYLDTQSTVRTRAKAEYEIRSSLDNEGEVLEATQNLVGSYLNAARWGQRKIDEHYSDKDNVELKLPAYEDHDIEEDEKEILKDFGMDGNDFPLFPFNKSAIKALSQNYLSEGGAIKFLPRSIINNVIKIHLNYRPLFEENRFPPTDLIERSTPSTEVTSWLNQVIMDNEQQSRMSSLITCWAGNPTNLKKLAECPNNIFTAFALPEPSALGLEPVNPVQQTLPSPQPENSPTPMPTGTNIPDFESWAVGKEDLSQGISRNLRTYIKDILAGSINWNEVNIKKVNNWPTIFISIPNSTGEGGVAKDNVIIKLDKKNEKKDAKLRKLFVALYRYNQNEKSLSYVEANEDMVTILHFLEDYRDEYKNKVLDKYHEATSRFYKILGTQSKIIGVSALNGHREIVESFTSTQQLDLDISSWLELVNETQKNRPDILDKVFNGICAYQGTGHKPLAIDQTRLKRISSNKALNSSDQFEVEDDRRKEKIILDKFNLSHLKEHLKEIVPFRLMSKLKVVIPKARQSVIKIKSIIGDSFDKKHFEVAIKEFIFDLQNAKSYPLEFKVQEVMEKLELLSKLEEQELIKKTSAIPEGDLSEDNLELYMEKLGEVKVDHVIILKEIYCYLNLFINAAEFELNRATKTASINPADLVKTFTDNMKVIKDDLEQISSVGEGLQ